MGVPGGIRDVSGGLKRGFLGCVRGYQGHFRGPRESQKRFKARGLRGASEGLRRFQGIT